MLVLLALFTILYAVVALLEARVRPLVDDSDEAAYFAEASWISEHGGIAGYVRSCAKGEYPFDNRHPLVQIAASPWARRAPEAARAMRTVKVVLAALSLLLISALALQTVGLWGAIPVVVLLALSRNWLPKSSLLCCEPVIYALFAAAWALISGAWRPRGRWFLAGSAMGLAWMAKGTAVLLPAGCLVAGTIVAFRSWRTHCQSLSQERFREYCRATLPLVAGFLLFGGTLLWNNTIRYGNPLHNRNSELMWADDWSAHALTPSQREASPLTFADYFRTHSAADMAARMARGAMKQAPRLLAGLAVESPSGSIVGALSIMLSAALILAGLWSVLGRWKSWEGLFTASVVGVGFLLFSWYSPITFSSRFAATFAPLLALESLRGDSFIAVRLRRALSKYGLAVGIAFIILGSGALALRLSPETLRAQRRPLPMSPEYRYLLDWYQTVATPEQAVIFETPYLGPRYALHWMLAPSLRVIPVPPFKSFQELQSYMDSEGATYLVIERDSLGERLAALGDFFKSSPSEGIMVKAVPAGWELYKADPWPPLDFVILRRMPRDMRTPKRSESFRLGVSFPAGTE
jgi:hypothetical protein